MPNLDVDSIYFVPPGTLVVDRRSVDRYWLISIRKNGWPNGVFIRLLLSIPHSHRLIHQAYHLGCISHQYFVYILYCPSEPINAVAVLFCDMLTMINTSGTLTISLTSALYNVLRMLPLCVDELSVDVFSAFVIINVSLLL